MKQFVFFFALSALAALSSATGNSYTAMDIGALAGGTVLPADMSENGVVAGRATIANGQFHAIVWTGSRLIDLGTFGGSFSIALDVSPNGRYVCGQAALSNGKGHAFLYDLNTGVMKDLGTLGGATSAGNAVNDSGTVVGQSDNVLGKKVSTVWQNNTCYPTQNLGGANSFASYINNDGDISGISDTTSATGHPFVVVNNEISDLAPGIPDGGGGFDIPVLNEFGVSAAGLRGVSQFGAVAAIFCNAMPIVLNSSNAGSAASVNKHFAACGTFYTVSSSLPFRTDGRGTFTPITMLPGSFGGFARSINDHGIVVGVCFGATANVGFYDDRGTMVDLNSLCDANSQGMLITDGLKVTGNDDILCTARVGNKTHAVILQKQ